MSVLAAKSDEPIPGYKVKSRLGAGGYGEVWTCEAPGQLLKAIKFVYGMLDEDRAARELKALNRIKGVRHPFLLSLERIEVVDGHLIIITELADGSLKDEYEKYRKAGDPGIPRDVLIAHLRDAADALDYMSDQHSLQHLDVKPENLLLVGGRIKVADFGLVKDIQESTASMMGGLTPVYAPPEVFEGNPSRRSDQYSLAIVFQEMLTGVLPFPGKTAAQLAAQHLNAKPRLTSLPAADQPVIARGLSKNPAERFSSCRELVNALEAAGKNPIVSAPSLQPPPTITQGPPKSLAATEAGPAAVPPLGQPTERPRTEVDMFNQLEAASQAAATALGNVSLGSIEVEALSLGGLDLEPPGPVVDCPPPNVSQTAQATAMRPTLVIGVGGTASRVLQRLRRRIKDRGDAPTEQRIGLLLLDTDSRDVMRAHHGEEGAALTSDETVAMPLRRTQDYRNDNSKHLEWLSRRWLYNIPRSLQTEGLRPLGRLALVDHADDVFAKTRSALERLVERESAAAKERGSAAMPPRVIVVGSIAGGTGSGSLVDVVYIARQLLDELNLAGGTVEAVFAHSTNRSPQAQELAAVNAFATLSELNHYQRPGVGFPGDHSCGLKPRQEPALAATYVVQLGNELSPDDYHHGCDRLAEFLLLDTVSPASGWLEACRQAPPSSAGDASSPARVRTFNVCQIGVGQDSLVDEATMRLCRTTLQRWTGTPRPATNKTSTRAIPLPSQTRPALHDSQSAKDSQIDTIAATQAATLGLDLDRLMQSVYAQAAKELEGNPDHCFRSIAMAFPAGSDGPPLDRWLAAVTELFGTRIGADGPAKVSPLQSNLDDHARALAAPIGAAARKWIESLVDHPSARLYGAQRATRWLQSHLKSLAERIRETRQRLNEEWYGVEQQLIASARPDPRQRNKTPQQPPEAILVQLCRMRLLELSAVGAGALVQTLLAHLLQAQDDLTDLARELQNLINRFPASDEEPVATEGDEMSQLKVAIALQLRQQEDEMAIRLDEALTTEQLEPSGGLRRVLHSNDQLLQFVDRLQTSARVAILRRVEQLDFASLLMKASAGGSGQLPNLLDLAQPALQACGGDRRLLCVLPAASRVPDGEVVRALQAEPRKFTQPPAIVRDQGSDLVLCFEMGNLSLPQVAAAIIDQRPDFLDCAERIHTRADVPWQPLLRFKG